MNFRTALFIIAITLGVSRACTPGQYACSNPQPDGHWIGLAQCASDGVTVVQLGTCQAGTHCEHAGAGVVCARN
ncbi:hypothetical protein CPB83DRAFT_864445 [Crepidotus variabilis]|uniref:Uncharacterized protein n=1 Tax=Crepidotus variabilis TaxID=179855 RepID=A0A9P6E4L8_9AGAR|nr:hypothetical protein CPB83DRAFT_864445 [Crepidotus variabilis]